MNDKIREVVDFGVEGEVKFPYFLYCGKCHGIKGYYKDSEKVKDPDTGLAIAYLKQGYWMARWEGKRVLNSKSLPHKCECDCDHEYEEIYGERKLYACEHHYRCKLCGDEMVVDSSG